MNILKDKRILITGSSSGIGREVAVTCAKNGAHVIVTGRNVERLSEVESEIKDIHNLCSTIYADLTKEEDIKTIVEECDKLDGIVLCAGQVLTAPIAFTPTKKLESMFQINLMPSVYLIQQLLKKKLLKSGASVVAITSILGVSSYMAGNAAYGVSKAALETWMRYCALEYARKGIRFNTIQPGGIDTPMVSISSLSEEQLIADKEQVPMGRYGKPEEVANAVLYFLSDGASYTTGSTLIIDGGRHLKY